MDLKSYLRKRDRNQFAIAIGTTKNYVNMLCSISKPSPKLAKKIEAATGGEVTVLELLFPEDCEAGNQGC